MMLISFLSTAAKPPIVVTTTSVGLVVAIVIAVVVVLIILALAGYLPYRSATSTQQMHRTAMYCPEISRLATTLYL